MGRNIRVKDDGTIRFNLFGHHLENGKIVKNIEIKERFYANFEDYNTKEKSIVGGVIRSRGNSAVITTKSIIHSIEEDDYCENAFNGDIWRIERIVEKLINVNSKRPLVERTLYLSK